MTALTRDMQAVVDRLGKLERQSRRWRLAAFLATIGLVAVFAMAQTSTPRELNAERVTARAFTLIDSTGKTRARWGSTEDGPALFLFDEAGRARVGLAATKEGSAGLELYDAAGNRKVGLNVTNDEPRLFLYDDAGKMRAGLTVSKDGSAALGFYDAAGKGRVGLTVVKDEPALVLYAGGAYIPHFECMRS